MIDLTRDVTLTDADIKVLRYISGDWIINEDGKWPLPGITPEQGACIIDRLTNLGFIGYEGAVGSRLIVTPLGRAQMEEHADD